MTKFQSPSGIQNIKMLSLSHCHNLLKILLKTVTNFSSYFGISQTDKTQLSHSLIGGGNNQVHYQKGQQRVDWMIIISNVLKQKEHEDPQCILLAHKELAIFLNNKDHYSRRSDEWECPISSRD